MNTKASESDEEAEAKLGGLALTLVAIGATLVALTVHGSMPVNAISSNITIDLQTTAWAPESWKFFTRDPQEEQLLIYAPKGGTWGVIGATSAAPEYVFGVNRAGRGQGVELGLILEGIPRSSYRSCGEEVEAADCIPRTTKILQLRNELPHPTLCGPIAIVARKPVPWAWATTGRKDIMPSRVLRFELECS